MSGSSYWDKPGASIFAPVREDPKAQANAAWVRRWLKALVDGEKSVEEFDAALPPKRSRLIAQYLHIYGKADEYHEVCNAQIDRRMRTLHGKAYCKWRGWVPLEDFDVWRWDRARERSQLPNKDRAA